MKRILYALTMLLFTACSDWFDVSPKTDVKAEEFFETESGFNSALAGIYVSLTDENAYGGNLSFGMLDQMAQLYDMIPDGTTSRASIYEYNVHTSGYDSKGKLANSWKKAYNIIANCNNLLKWLDRNGTSAIADDIHRRELRGEALAIRAYVHFDLLRGWGPVFSMDSTAKAIPYRTVADNSRQPLLPANIVAQRILDDIDEAETLLSHQRQLDLSAAINRTLRFRFNFHALEALKARACLWFGRTAEAAEAAKNVIDNCGLTLQTSNQGDPVLFDECLLAVNLYQMTQNLSSKFTEDSKLTSHYYLTTGLLNDLFEATGSSSDVDIRVKSAAFIRFDAQQKAITRKYTDNPNEAIPLIRLPEMYYILCETSDLDDAPPYINTVRNRRGYARSTDFSFFDNDFYRDDALDTEYRKEFYAEGQYFYFLKRKQSVSFINSPAEFVLDNYMFPLPDAEQEYGWISDNSTETSN